MPHFDQTACKIRFCNLCVRFGTWKVQRLNQSCSKFQIRSKVEISSRAGHEERLSRSKLIQTPNFSRT